METSLRGGNHCLSKRESVPVGDDDSEVVSLQPPPPGFGGDALAVAYDGTSLRMLGALSAPPPPGFNSGFEERRRISQLLWSDEGYRPNDADGGNLDFGLDERTTSYSNLAAVVGTGLVESMEDSTRETSAVTTESTAAADPLDSSRNRVISDIFDPKQDLSYARQSRHAASRLIGTSTSLSTNQVNPMGYCSLSTTEASPLGMGSGLSTQKDQQAFLEAASRSPPFAAREMQNPFVSSACHQRENVSPCSPSRWTLPAKDVGVTVMEPLDLGRNSAPPKIILGAGITGSQSEISVTSSLKCNIQQVESDMQSLSITDERRRSLSEPHYAHQARHPPESELSRFFWDVCQGEPSRMLVLLHASSLYTPDVKSTCEAFGVLEVLRVDFAAMGVIFVGYYDIRSAQYAALELKSCLKRLAVASLSLETMNGCSNEIDVKYCVPLNWSSALDESRILLAEVPADTDFESLTNILSSYGAVRNVCQLNDRDGFLSVVVEFHNIQDAKQAMLELESAQPWGGDVIVEFVKRDPAQRKKGRDLIALIGSWRHGRPSANASRGQPLDLAMRGAGNEVFTTPRSSASPVPSRTPSDGTPPQPNFSSFRMETPSEIQNPAPNSSASSSPMVSAPETSASAYGQSSVAESESCSSRSHQTTQLLLGPDGQYSYVVVNPSAYQHGARPHTHPDSATVRVLHSHPAAQHYMLGHHGPFVQPSQNSSIPVTTGGNGQQHGNHWTHPPPTALGRTQYHLAATASTVMRTSPFVEPNGRSYGGAAPIPVPFCAHVPTGHVGSSFGVYTDSSVSSGSGSNPHPLGGTPDHCESSGRIVSVNVKDANHLVLNVGAVEKGQDKRTSVMVRNIPNKYTQQMLLSEFTENGHGPGVIDFFYLPIDFKNRCNRGYAFVNFVDYRDIMGFHARYYGQRWRVFNSDKICDITYARIQGQTGLLKRFENSALMEKDDEYKPLVFVSDGTEKGKRVIFPST